MFNRLIASGKRRSQWVRNPWVIGGSVGVHLLALAGMIWASGGDPAAPDEPEPEEVTFIDITELPPEPEEIFEAPPEAEAESAPAPASPREAAATPPRAPAAPRAAPETPTAPDEPGGFQELREPSPTVQGVPAPDPSAAPVRAEDFGGRGEAGGRAGGTPTAAPAGSTPTGTGTGTGTGTRGGTGSGPPTGTFTANLVDRAASLQNSAEVARILQRLYPENLRRSGTGGRVVVELVVDANGRVEPGSVQVVSSSHPGFTDVSLQAVNSFRFRPAQVGPYDVRMRVQIPITWQPAR